MAEVDRSCVSLRISGDDLVPAEVTELLGCEPSFSHTKGQEVPINDAGRTRIATFGYWLLKVQDSYPADLDSQVSDLLSKLTSDLSIWKQLAGRFKIDLFVGLMLKEANEGCDVTAASMQLLGERSIPIELDIYSGEDDEDDFG